MHCIGSWSFCEHLIVDSPRATSKNGLSLRGVRVTCQPKMDCYQMTMRFSGGMCIGSGPDAEKSIEGVVAGGGKNAVCLPPRVSVETGVLVNSTVSTTGTGLSERCARSKSSP